MLERLKELFFDRILPGAFSIIVVLCFLGLLYISIPRDIDTYLKAGYKIVYQNTNPITEVTRFTLMKDKHLRFCTAYVSVDGKTMTQSECKRDE